VLRLLALMKTQSDTSLKDLRLLRFGDLRYSRRILTASARIASIRRCSLEKVFAPADSKNWLGMITSGIRFNAPMLTDSTPTSARRCDEHEARQAIAFALSSDAARGRLRRIQAFGPDSVPRPIARSRFRANAQPEKLLRKRLAIWYFGQTACSLARKYCNAEGRQYDRLVRVFEAVSEGTDAFPKRCHCSWKHLAIRMLRTLQRENLIARRACNHKRIDLATADCVESFLRVAEPLPQIFQLEPTRRSLIQLHFVPPAIREVENHFGAVRQVPDHATLRQRIHPDLSG
jgi:hypothetical protein